MIIKYHPDKIYDKKTFNNAVRRAVQHQLIANYNPRQIDSKVFKMFNRLFGLGIMLKIACYQAQKTRQVFNWIGTKLLNRKEGKICHCRIQ